MPPVTTRLPRLSATLARRPNGVVGVACAVGSMALLSGCGGGTSVDWAIVESTDRGETLVVAPLVALRSCDGQPKADVRKSNANRVELEITVEQGSCDDEVARPAPPLRVKLAQPLRGQQITGAGLQSPARAPGSMTADTVPSVVGFRLPDARAILKARGLEVGAITGPKADATEVTAQSPAAGAPLATTPAGIPAEAIALRTVPR